MNSFHAVSPHSLTHSTLSSSQIHFPRSHTGWNTLWWSYLTSRGWPNCKEVRGVTLRPQSICSYRIFVNVLAARENELAFSAARHVAGGCRAAGSLYLLYRRCEASTSYMRARSRRKRVLSVHFIPSLINGERSGKGMHLTSNSKEKKERESFLVAETEWKIDRVDGVHVWLQWREDWWFFSFPPFLLFFWSWWLLMSKAAVDQRMGDLSLRSFIPNAFLEKGTARAISALPVAAVCVCVCVVFVTNTH